ncbi:MAG: YdiU family protein [Acaryochloris sp. RU_4_1]|nr:YdiU family protein [Acaryochloris sp. SU_5_25]NJM68411.1 YdiU family protein [Acaryochloris sp. RU_4_1]NJR57101.1 YdiU family protein [Acaryochloris sp. CRU_2_0]
MTPSMTTNPLLTLDFEPAFESLGDRFYDRVTAAEFPHHILRFRNNSVLAQVGLDPQQVTDIDFIEALGQFQGREPLLALGYHGYQFGDYNPRLGDGRGFLYGQVRGKDGEMYDLGTKGSGTTPYSRGADGRLTLKGGVREVLAAEALHHLGVRTSRCFSLIETGEALWRGDEPSPTRSSVMVRFSRSHIRFGTFERLHALGRVDLIQTLLDHVIAYYYPHLWQQSDAYPRFYAELVQRTAELVAQWMSVGFCHAVLNTDNMSITGESFDYGPYAFIESYDVNFTAAYFDHFQRYSYGNQPTICHWNLEMLQRPLTAIIPQVDLDAGLAQFKQHYYKAYRQQMLSKLGFVPSDCPESEDLLVLTLDFLQRSQINYHHFFAELRRHFNETWCVDPGHIFSESDLLISPGWQAQLEQWRQLYHRLLQQYPEAEILAIKQRLQRHNPLTVITRPQIEAIWEPIVVEDNWQPFNNLVQRLQEP